jgi:hypothetical protein
MTTETKGGLVGAVGSMARAGYGAKSIIPSSNKVALWLVFFAGAITVLKKAGVAIPDYAVWFGVALGIAALLYEMTSSKDMIRAWWNGSAGSMLASGVIWFCAFAFSINNWVGAASENQVEKSNLHKTALMTTQNVTGSLAQAEKKLARLTEERSLMKPTQSVAAARAVVQTSEAHKWFTGLTEGCKVTKGAQTRGFCEKYFSAQADVALWDQIAKQEIAIGDAESAVTAAKATMASTKIETSEERGDLVLLTKYAGMSEFDAQTLQGLFAIIVVSIFISFGSMRSEHEELAKIGPRKPFNWFLKLRRALSHIFYGREPGDVTVIVEKHETTKPAGPKTSLLDISPELRALRTAAA